MVQHGGCVSDFFQHAHKINALTACPTYDDASCVSVKLTQLFFTGYQKNKDIKGSFGLDSTAQQYAPIIPQPTHEIVRCSTLCL